MARLYKKVGRHVHFTHDIGKVNLVVVVVVEVMHTLRSPCERHRPVVPGACVSQGKATNRVSSNVAPQYLRTGTNDEHRKLRLDCACRPVGGRAFLHSTEGSRGRRWTRKGVGPDRLSPTAAMALAEDSTWVLLHRSSIVGRGKDRGRSPFPLHALA